MTDILIIALLSASIAGLLSLGLIIVAFITGVRYFKDKAKNEKKL